MARIHDPGFLTRLVQRFSLREQPPGILEEPYILPVVDVGNLLSTPASLGTSRLEMAFAGQMSGLTNLATGDSIHYPVQQNMIIRGAWLDITAVNTVAPTAAGEFAVNASIFIVRQATPTYAATTNAPTNTRSQSGSGLPLGAAVVTGPAIVSRSDAIELILPMTDEQWLAIGAFATVLHISGGLYDLSIPLFVAQGGSAQPDFIGFHADIGLFPTGVTAMDIIYKAAVWVDLVTPT